MNGMKLTNEKVKEGVEKYKEKFLNGKVTNEWISRMTGYSPQAVGYHTSKWVEEFIAEKNKEIEATVIPDNFDFDYLKILREHNESKRPVTVEECKGLTRKEIQELVDKIPNIKTLL
jgi:anaerobic selenocysteine-containing dehydrogenase